MLMAHLHATFQALAPLRLPLSEIMERASRMLCESTLPTYFATLACGKAHRSGEVEMSNAGHNPPLLVQGSNVVSMEATGLPLGMFCEEHFSVSKVNLTPGDTIIAYTDGLSEAVDASGAQYGTDRLLRIVKEHRIPGPDGPDLNLREGLASIPIGCAESRRSHDHGRSEAQVADSP
jgi:sigma-B regulation protein RsbU (phosphoserine phosphatase)